MTVRAAPELVPVEEVRAGDTVLVTPKTGPRPVLRVERYDPLPYEPDGRDVYVVVYQPSGPGLAWENRASAAVGPSMVQRSEASLASRRAGDLIPLTRRAAA